MTEYFSTKMCFIHVESFKMIFVLLSAINSTWSKYLFTQLQLFLIHSIVVWYFLITTAQASDNTLYDNHRSIIDMNQVDIVKNQDSNIQSFFSVVALCDTFTSFRVVFYNKDNFVYHLIWENQRMCC